MASVGHVVDLPSSGLLFPLALRRHAKDDKVLVRTLLAVDHEKSSMTFATQKTFGKEPSRPAGLASLMGRDDRGEPV